MGVTETDVLQKHLCSLFFLNVDDFLPRVLNGKVGTSEATINRGETRLQLRLVWIPSRINGEVVGAIIVGELNTPSDALPVDVNIYRLANEDPLTNLPNKVAGLVVDSFIGQHDIVLKSLGNYLTNVFAISGATILGNGQVALIVDTNALIK
jgi:hypothetical protein